MENLEKKLSGYRKKTSMALKKIAIPKRLGKQQQKQAETLIAMAKAYYSDAQYFEKKGLKLTALAAYSYAHAWLDAGVKTGLLDGKNDSKLFTLP